MLRQDPDIILVGEMRDLETISVALTAAETGHLVFATLHTQDAAQTIDRIIDVFPPHQQQQVRVQLAGALQGVVCQTLARTRGRSRPCGRHRGPGRHPGDPQPDPRGQDAPDLLGDAGRREARHAHDGPAPRRPGDARAGSPTRPASRSATTSKTSTGSPAEAERQSDGSRNADVPVLGPRQDRQVVSGTLEADSQATVAAKLKQHGLRAHQHQQAQGRHEDRDQDPGLRRQGQAQGPRGHVPPVRRR